MREMIEMIEMRFQRAVRETLEAKFSHGRIALHTAAERGDLNSVEDLLNQNPDLATTVDAKGWLPLHLASAKGHLKVVKRLLNNKITYASLNDYGGQTPLHMAARAGHIEVAKLLIRKLTPVIMGKKRTGYLQMCLIRCGRDTLQQVEAADPYFLNGFDEEGNTLLHAAALLNNLEVVRYLVGRDDLRIAQNKYGLTALDIVKRRSKGSDDDDTNEIRALLETYSERWEHMMKKFLGKKWNAILVAASITGSMTFQPVLNPPGGFLQEDKRDPGGDLIAPIGTSVMAFTNPYKYLAFSTVNTLSFVSSMCIIGLLVSRLRMKRNIFMWLLTVGMWFTITSMGYTYFDTVQFSTPMKARRLEENPFGIVCRVSVSTWVGLTTTILLVRTNHITKFFKKMRVLSANGLLGNNASCISVSLQKHLWVENQDDGDADQHGIKNV